MWQGPSPSSNHLPSVWNDYAKTCGTCAAFERICERVADYQRGVALNLAGSGLSLVAGAASLAFSQKALAGAFLVGGFFLAKRAAHKQDMVNQLTQIRAQLPD